jgi:NADH-quinone oxidoreductase subunit L
MRDVAIWLIPALPLAGFVGLLLLGARLSTRAIAGIGAGSVGLAALGALLLGGAFLVAPPPGGAITLTLWQWMRVESFTPAISLRLDALSLVMLLVVTIIGFLIHLYATDYMAEDDGYHRFFAYMNLFVGAMLLLVLADDLLLLYLGWEAVGLCSYLLIGFWYREPANGRAAMKAFIVTRIGDAALAVALLLIFTSLGTLAIPGVLAGAAAQWPVGAPVAVAAAALLLAGAAGKSAQLPLQVWLPDAMAGPTPVSALIHAATMVTAGVYLIARLHPLFLLAPPVLTVVALIGVTTLLLAGVSALVQWDLKRVLAYSTISQLGYMFLALGVGAWTAAIFHLTTHACFKALLFLAAGVVGHRLHTYDLREMGGMRSAMPLTFWTFLIGALSLAALPLVTAGFFSKDLILYEAWSSALGGRGLWAGAWIGALLTAWYALRMVLLAFAGTPSRGPAEALTPAMRLPLVVLAVLSVGIGVLQLPRTLGASPLFSTWLSPVLPPAPLVHAGLGTEGALQLASALASVLGLGVAFLLYQRGFARATRPSAPLVAAVRRWWEAGWGFDWLYEALFVRPFRAVARANRHDVVDGLSRGLVVVSLRLYAAFSATETGNVRWYAAGLALGAVLVIAVLVLR